MNTSLYRQLLLLILCFITIHAKTQTVTTLTSGRNTSLRGLCVVNERIIWVSGSNGTVGRSVDSGNTWKWFTIQGFEKADFRDIEAFNETSAVVMAVNEPAYILRTSDGGDNWKVVYENKTKGMFLDAMEFWNENSGIVIGDPIDGGFFIARSFNGGITWRDIPIQNFPRAENGEACFAASGTNIRELDKDEACFVTGGKISRLFIRDKKIILPFAQGQESNGANSVAVKNNKTLIVVGGDYTKPDSISQNCFITTDGGKTWSVPKKGPYGYRSCVEYIQNNRWICCGLNGVDITEDNGFNWELISKDGFNVCLKAKKGNIVFLAGNNGKIARLQ